MGVEADIKVRTFGIIHVAIMTVIAIWASISENNPAWVICGTPVILFWCYAYFVMIEKDK